ncbi:MAG: DegQ family serine endoprotease [Syntrophales bacterium]|nr:DegQ family serine endoprotease [Syntrophales bacterium]
MKIKAESKSRKTFFAVLLVFLMGVFVVSMVGTVRFSPVFKGTYVDDALAASVAEAIRPPDSFADLAEKLKPAVVNISTTKVIKSGAMQKFMSPFGEEFPFDRFFGGDEFFKKFFGDIPEKEFKQKSLGSGFIISNDGYIFTNNHVVEKADKIKVKLSDGKEYDAEVKGKDAKTDIALIKIKPTGSLPVVSFGDSDNLRVGDWVIAIGNPFGLEHTVTAGIVSAKGRVIGSGPYDNFIQTDASINPGNSGGPLFNLQGKVVGINTAMIARGQGIGFAIPINMAKGILTDLKTKGKVVRGWLGVSVQEITEDIAKNLGLKDAKGVLVNDVFKGDPADRAGVKTGDIILEVGGKKIKDTHELLRIVATLSVGKKVELKILSNGKEKVLQIVVAEREKSEKLAKAGEMKEYFGMTVQEITPEIAAHLGLSEENGVIVTHVQGESPADDGGVKPQDIILQVNKVKISSMEDYIKAISLKDAKDSCMLLIKRGRTSFFVVIRK